MHPQPPEACARLAGDSSGGSLPAACSLVTLEQELQPAAFLPPPLGRVLQPLACKQLRGIFRDMQREARHINAGRPTLWPAAAPGTALS